MAPAAVLAILVGACFLGMPTKPTQGQTAMPTLKDVMSNGVPTPIVDSKEVYITREEIAKTYPNFIYGINRVIESYGVDTGSEKITHSSDFGYIIRYEITHDSNAHPALRSFLVLWTKEFEKF